MRDQILNHCPQHWLWLQKKRIPQWLSRCWSRLSRNNKGIDTWLLWLEDPM
jgi:hypothetical protein